MSQKTVYVRRPVLPPPYFDPDPDPIAFTTILLVAVVLGGLSTAGVAIQNPSFFTQLLVTLNPSIKELAEDQQKAQQEFWRIVLIIAFIILAIVGLFIFYRYWSHKKERKKAIRRYRNARNKTLRMLRR